MPRDGVEPPTPAFSGRIGSFFIPQRYLLDVTQLSICKVFTLGSHWVGYCPVQLDVGVGWREK